MPPDPSPAAGFLPEIGREPAPSEAIADVLALARGVLAVPTALVSRVDGGSWEVTHVDDAAFGLTPGAVLPLEDTF